jgi:hypothetical protein
MRHVVVLVVFTAVLVLSATPALADRRKSTITLGVDPNGVAIQIDTTLSGEGSTPGASGGASAPCTYVPATVGLETLYSQQGANLFSVTCGSYTDVRLLRTGPDGQPLQPGPTVNPFQLAMSARDRLSVPEGAIEANRCDGGGGGDPDRLPVGVRRRRDDDQRGARPRLSGPLPNHPHLPDGPPGRISELHVRVRGALAYRRRTLGAAAAPIPHRQRDS